MTTKPTAAELAAMSMYEVLAFAGEKSSNWYEALGRYHYAEVVRLKAALAEAEAKVDDLIAQNDGLTQLLNEAEAKLDYKGEEG